MIWEPSISETENSSNLVPSEATPGGTAFDALGGDVQIGQQEGETLEGAKDCDEGSDEFDRHIVHLSLWYI